MIREQQARIYRIKAMIHRFFYLFESQNTDFSLVRELLCEDKFEWLSPRIQLIGVHAFEQHFYTISNDKYKVSDRPFEMSVKLLDDNIAILNFNFIYQNVIDGEMVLHAKGNFEVNCIDKGEEYPRMQTCNITVLEMIYVGDFIDMSAINKALYLDYKLKAKQILIQP